MKIENIKFQKMHGAGNDYVYFDAFGDEPIPSFSAKEIAWISNRRYGVGGDGVVIIAPSQKADARMLMWNADGTSSAMCGNALRCVALATFRRTQKKEMILESGCGVHKARILSGDEQSAFIEIDMGQPAFEKEKIPYTGAGNHPFMNIDLSVPGYGVYNASLVSMGNPHCVIFCDDADSILLEKIGPLIEHHPLFPERTNVEFVSFRGSIPYQRTFERGSGETLACGSGACAVLVAGFLNGKIKRKSEIILRGGTLEVEWMEAGNVFLRGGAEEVFRGTFSMNPSLL